MTGPRRPAAERGRTPAAGRGANSVRIVGGSHRGRKIAFPDAPGLRPTGDRIRETLFNWLAPVLPGSRCLDLFAGSGVLGIEAASRGAAGVVLVESAPRVARALQRAIDDLHLGERVHLIEADALRWLGTEAPVPFDVVFLDPPFAAGLMAEAVVALEQGGWLADGALVYLERAQAQGPWPIPAHWKIVRHKQAGQVSYALARRQPPEMLPSDVQPCDVQPSSRGPKGRGDP